MIDSYDIYSKLLGYNLLSIYDHGVTMHVEFHGCPFGAITWYVLPIELILNIYDHGVVMHMKFRQDMWLCT